MVCLIFWTTLRPPPCTYFLLVLLSLSTSVQTLAILFFVIPLYLDAFITILGTLCKKCYQLAKGTSTKFKARCRKWGFRRLYRPVFPLALIGKTCRRSRCVRVENRADRLLERCRHLPHSSLPTKTLAVEDMVWETPRWG